MFKKLSRSIFSNLDQIRHYKLVRGYMSVFELTGLVYDSDFKHSVKPY